MATTPIRSVVLMIETANDRQNAVERASTAGDWSSNDWAAASRIWSRQQHALASAIIEEPPQTFDDVLAVLINLANRHDLVVGEGEDASERELRDLGEMTGVAIKNIIARLAGMFRPDDEPTESMHRDLDCNAAQVAKWLPPVPPADNIMGER
jgi:hypothetical protein